jgi:hypothetical protein
MSYSRMSTFLASVLPGIAAVQADPVHVVQRGDAAYGTGASVIGLAAAWLATALCVARGLPVTLDAGHLFRPA